MGLVDPTSAVSDALSLEPTILESNVGGVADDLVRARCCASHILKVLPHETVSASGVSSVDDL